MELAAELRLAFARPLITGAPWSILPLWLSTNFGYRLFAEKLPSKADGVYREPMGQAVVPSPALDELVARV